LRFNKILFDGSCIGAAALQVQKTCTESTAQGSGTRAEDYFAFISATVVSSMRLEKPHSLSYQDDTFTRRPETLVRVAPKFDDAGCG
jgi:hypothetical protein